MRKKKKRSAEDWVLDIFIYSFLIFLTIVTVYPMWYVVVASFSPASYIANQGSRLLWPGEFSLAAYKMAFEHRTLMLGFKNSILILVMSLPINLFLTLLCGYFMASTKMMWKKPIIYMMLFTMFFSGGLIPAYLNVKQLGLYDSLWALVLPGALSIYNANICKTAMEGIPESLSESAYIDGANDCQVLFKILVPLLKPTIAVLTLYYGVAHWNAWFNAMVYIDDKKLKPAQLILRNILVENQALANEGGASEFSEYAEAIQYSAIVIITVPILCVYPFLQKHFAKGVMIGAVKG